MRRGLVILIALTLGWALSAGVSTASADTFVSLTFDDGNTDQLAAQPILAEHGMDATFYIITDRVSVRPGVFTWDDIASLFADGNEIGGHTTNHVSLTEETPEEAMAAVCDARQVLLAHGYPQVSFAYPRGDNDAATEQIVEECGYLSGRDVTVTADWPMQGETIPPADPLAIRTPGSIDVDDTLASIEQRITAVEAADDANGSADAWIPLVIHHICDPNVTNCSDLNGVADQYITPQDFDSLLDWLQAREPTTRVETMARVMDPAPPTSQISCNGAACQLAGYESPVSVTLSATDTGRSTGASGVQNIRYTTDGSNPTSSSPVYSGPISVASTTTIKFRAEDNAGNVESPVHSETIEVALPPATSSATLAAFSSKSFRNGTAKLKLDVTGPGELEAADASTGTATAAAGRLARIKPSSKTVAQPGTVTLVIRASKAGKRILRRKGKMTVPVRVTFTPLSGSAASQTVKLKLRLIRHRGA
ncbi:MAG TPA: polysaccharide deacetylase family protein [Solirubrobacterales bacterium]